MSKYIHQLREWPEFQWSHERLASSLGAVRLSQGRLLGQMETLGPKEKSDAVLRTLTEDVVKTSEIEGGALDVRQVRSSLARRLGIDIGALKPPDRDVDGIVEMMLDATQRYTEPLGVDRLFAWHAALFPTGRSGMRRIRVGAWRDARADPMEVVSGSAGRERVHFEAPGAARVPGEMDLFLDWFNGAATSDPLLKAAQAHLWFVTIHPFEDGNGRIARAISDLALARSESSPRRFYSMSSRIREERGDYYRILERTQRGTMEITPWMEWFLGCLMRAIEIAQGALAGVMTRARLWERWRDVPLNSRQRLVLHRLLDGVKGTLTSSRWASLAKCSQDTALRDINHLVERGVLRRNPGGGRSASYSLEWEEPKR